MTSAALERVRDIEQARARASLGAHAGVLASAALLFASFVIGYALGPSSLRWLELVLGGAGALLLGLAVAKPFARRRRDAGARARHVLREGRSKRQALIFDDYVLLDEEPVLRESVDRVERAGQKIVLRYQDPVAGGPLLRELEGPGRALDAIADALGSGAAGSA
jgi:hypothetical protein